MLLVLPFHTGDVHQALALLRFIHDLGGVGHHDALLVADAATPWNDARDCHKLAQRCFKSVTSITNAVSVKGWIPGSCSLFKAAATWAKGRPWFWLEPDAAPLHPTWLDEIEEAYAKCGKPFMGAVVTHQTPGWPNPYLEGCAVYPPDAWANLAGLFNPRVSWTRTCAPYVVPHAANTPLIHHVWGRMGMSPTFDAAAPANPNKATLSQIRPDACLFHRCKDGSLIKALREKMHLAAPSPAVPATADVVSLRRSGDIINLLPMLKVMSESNGHLVKLVVHRDFMPLLEGVSYVIGEPWDGEWEDPLAAAAKFKAKNAQVFGKGLRPDIKTKNFAKLAWEMLGVEWNRHMPLVFDRRNYGREAELAESVFKTDKPKILVKTHGFSSPFPESEFVLSAVSTCFGEDAELVNLDDVKADRVFDLVGLMDRSACLITSDTVTLWLAQATKCPVVAFTNGVGFSASPPRGNSLLRIPYGHVKIRWPLVREVIKTTLAKDNNDAMVLVHSDYTPVEMATRLRQKRAVATWPLLGARVLPFQPKRSSVVVGDNRGTPFIRDMVKEAMETGRESIVIVINNDIKVDSKLAEAIRKSCIEYGCYWAYRVERQGGETDQGIDLFAFTRSWWGMHQHLFPDFLLGAPRWDEAMCRIMRWSGCIEQDRLYYHEPHMGVVPAVESGRIPKGGMDHNDMLWERWLKEHDERHKQPVAGQPGKFKDVDQI